MDDSKASTSQVGAPEAGADPTGIGLAGLISRVLGQLSGGRVLDVATGEGGFVGVLRQDLKDYVDITGVDWDLDSLAKAQKAVKGEEVRFCQMDAERLAFGDGAFDTVNISASLHHLADPGRALREMARVIRPGGKLIVEEMHRDGQAEAQRVAVGIHHWAAEVDRALGLAHYPTLGRQELVDLVECLGLEEVSYHDWVDLGSDPRDEALSEGVEGYMDRRLQRADGHPGHGALVAQGEALRRELHHLGIQREPVIIIVGMKRA
jgi:SAM-dependent methyltransferase